MNQISIHDQIYNYLLQTYSDAVVKHPRQIFYNYQRQGLRLTKFGHQLMRQEFDHYEFVIDRDQKITAGDLLRLDRGMQWPYYIHRDILVLYSEDDATIIKLVGGYQNWVRSVN